MQPERRAYSFDVSRESVASEVDVGRPNNPDPAIYGAGASDQRSFTDSTVSTTALVEGLEALTPPFGTPKPENVVVVHRGSAQNASPPPTHRAGYDLTPRPLEKSPHPVLMDEPLRQYATVPYIELHIAVSTPMLDVGFERDIWVAVEASVETQVIDLTAEA